MICSRRLAHLTSPEHSATQTQLHPDSILSSPYADSNWKEWLFKVRWMTRCLQAIVNNGHSQPHMDSYRDRSSQSLLDLLNEKVHNRSEVASLSQVWPCCEGDPGSVVLDECSSIHNCNQGVQADALHERIACSRLIASGTRAHHDQVIN